MGANCMPQVFFLQFSKINQLCCFYIVAHTEAIAIIFIYEVIGNIFPFVLNIEWPLVLAMLPRYYPNNSSDIYQP